MCGVGIKKAAAVGAQHLDGHLGGHRSHGNRLGFNLLLLHHGVALRVFNFLTTGVLFSDLGGVGIEHLGGLVGTKVLDHPLGHQNQGKHQADGQQQVEAGPGQIAPEIADGFSHIPGNAPHQGRGDRNAHGGRNKVMKGQAHHLRQIGQGAFAAIVLPVGVGGETGRSIKGQICEKRPRSPGD